MDQHDLLSKIMQGATHLYLFFRPRIHGKALSKTEAWELISGGMEVDVHFSNVGPNLPMYACAIHATREY